MSFQFNEEYYLAQYPDVAEAVANGSISSALSHWQNIGFTENRNPNENFNTAEYLEANPDVADAVQNGMNPLNHFLKFGAAEGRAPSVKYKEIAEEFDADAYLIDNPDVADAIANGANLTAYKHWVLFGQFEEGRPEAKLEDGRTVNEVLNPETAPTLTLTESTDAAAAADAVASVASATATSGTLAAVETVSVTIGEGEDAQTITVEEIDASAGADALVDALNADEAFAEAGLVAAYENGTLTITDAQGRALSGVQLLDGGAEAVPSTGEISVSAGVLFEADVLTLVIDGETIEVDGIQDWIADNATATADTLAGYIQGQVRLHEVTVTDEEGNETTSTPFGDITVAHDGNSTLTVTDPAGRQIETLTLVDNGDQAVASVASIDVNNTQSLEVAQVELVINGETVTVEASGSGRAALATSLETALAAEQDEDGNPLYANIEVTSENGQLVVTDNDGREITSVRLLDEGDAAVASSASFSVTDGQARLDVGRFSITIGDEEVSLEAIDVADDSTTPIADLVGQIIAAINTNANLAAGAVDSGANIIVSASGSTVTITDTLGREISNVAVGTSGDAVEDSTATIVSTQLDKADAFRITVDGTAYEVEIDDTNGATVADEITAAAGTQTVDGELILPAGISAEINAEGELVVTDAQGRQLSDVELVDVDSSVPSTVTISGLSNAIARLEAEKFSITIGDTVVDLADVNVGDTVNVADAAGGISGLASNIQDAINGAINGSDVVVSVNDANNTLTITDPDGREISNVSLTQDGGEGEATVTRLFGVAEATDAEGNDIPFAEAETPVTLGAFSANVTVLDDNNVVTEVPVLVDLRSATSVDLESDTTSVVSLINAALNANPLTAGKVTAAYEPTENEELQLVLTNADGFANSDVKLTTDAVLSEVVPSTATVAVTDPADVSSIEFTVGAEVVTLNDASLAAATNLSELIAAINNTAPAGLTVEEETDAQGAGTGKLLFTDAQGRDITSTGFEVLDAVSEDAAASFTDGDDGSEAVAPAEDTAASFTDGDTGSEATTEPAAPAVASTATFAVTDPADVSSVTIDLGGQPYTLSSQAIVDATTGTELASALQAAFQTAVDADVSVAWNDTNSNFELSDAAGRDFTGTNFEVLDAALADGGASFTDGAAGEEAEVTGAGQNSYAEDIVTVDGTPAGQGGAQVGNDAVINNGVEASTEEGDERDLLGEVSVVEESEITNGNTEGAGSTQVGSDAVIDNGSTAGGNAQVIAETGEGSIENGSEAGINAEQVGADAVIDNGSVAGLEPQVVAETTVENGSEATDATAWTATLDVAFEAELEADYTFTLSLTEVLGEDAAEGTEAAVFNFTVDAVAGETSADVLANMAAAIDADEAFAAVVSEEGQLVVTAEAEATNYTVETGVELVAVEEPQIVEAA